MKKKLIHLVVLSCKKATFLIEKSQQQPLWILDRLQLRVHLKICSGCAIYSKQSLLLNSILKKQDSFTSLHSSSIKLSDNAKELMQSVLEKKIKKI